MLLQISRAHFGIADITGLNSNVLLELGAMISVDKPLLIMRDKSDKAPLPFDISGYGVYKYEIGAKGAKGVQILDSTSETSLEEFVDKFTTDLINRDKTFREASSYRD